MQVLVALLTTAEGEQDTVLIWTLALAVRVKLWVTPLRLAVRSADGLVLTAATAAVKEPLV